MTQNPNPQNAPIPAPSTPAAPAPQQSDARSAITEEVIFDGSPAWLGRCKAFVLTWILAMLLVIVPVFLLVYGTSVPWWVTTGAVVIALLLVVGQYAYHRTIRFHITNYRIDFERGLLTRRIDSLELWHADDLYFRQTLAERLMGLGSIDVISDDRSNPRLRLNSIADARVIFDRLKLCVLNAKRQRGLLQLDQG